MLEIFAIGTYIGILLIPIILLFLRKSNLIKKYGLHFAFTVVLTAMIGSLYISEVLLKTPCTLCWYQRILTFPQVLLLGIAAYNEDKNIVRYLIPINILGLLIAGYHIFIQFTQLESVFCSASINCSEILSVFGISVPIMSATTYALVLLFLALAKR